MLVVFSMARELGFPPRPPAGDLVARGCEKVPPALPRSFGFALCCSKMLASLQPVRIPALLTIIKVPPKGETFIMARELGFEPRTDRLTADSSTAELLPNMYVEY